MLLPGRAALPGPRRQRMLHDLLGKQLSAVAGRTQRTVSGQAGFLAFLCPETRLACFQVTGADCLFVFTPDIAGMGPGGRIPPPPVADAGGRRPNEAQSAGARARAGACATMPNCGRRALARDEPPMTACGRSTNDRLRRADISFVLSSTEREQSLLWRVATFEVADNISSAVRSAETSKSP